MNKIYGRAVGATTPPIDSYTKEETDELLDTKASSEEVESLRLDVKISVPNQIADSLRPIDNRVSALNERVDSVDYNALIHGDNTNNPHLVTASQVGAYTKSEVDSKLSNKADKSDIANVYKYKGSVDKFEDLYTEYKVVPNDVPTYKGELWGTFENGCFSVNPIEDESWVTVDIPIEEITLKKGYYVVNMGDIQRSGAASWINIDMGGYILQDVEMLSVIKIDEDTVISGATIAQHSGGYLNSATGTLVCTFCKVDDKFIEESGDDYQLKSDDYMPKVGDVYNIIKDGMNYAWTGTDWDALGGEHKDLEARWQIGNVDAALDTILEIQNALIGGDA